MSRRDVEKMAEAFVARGGKVEAKFYGEDVNTFNREELLLVLENLIEQLEWERKSHEMTKTILDGVNQWV